MRGGPIVPPPLPRTVPPELATIVLRAVERDREDRFASAADLREAIVHVPGQPADPARQLADFLGEVKRRKAGALDDVLIDAVLGGNAPTRVARGQGARARWPWAAGAVVLAATVVGGAALQHRRPHAVTPTMEARPLPPASATSAAPKIAPTPTHATADDAAPATTKPSPTLAHKRHPRGMLSVNAIPWANVFIDGRAAGHTPRRRLALEAGRHQLKLVTQAGDARSRTVEIAPNHETTLTVVFSEP